MWVDVGSNYFHNLDQATEIIFYADGELDNSENTAGERVEIHFRKDHRTWINNPAVIEKIRRYVTDIRRLM